MAFVKIIQSFFMPSVFIVLFVIAGVILLKKHKKKWGKALLVMGALSYYLFSISPISDFMLMSLEEKYSPLATNEVDRAEKAVVLLGGRESNVLRGSEALRLWHLSGGNMELIVSGTDPFFTQNNEAQAVRNYFVHRGVDPEKITIEGESHNTRENVAKVSKIVKDEPFFLVTSAFHMERSIREFKRLGVNPIPAPTDFKRKRVAEYGFGDFIPNGQNLRNSNLAIHEYLGTIYYRLIFLFGN